LKTTFKLPGIDTIFSQSLLSQCVSEDSDHLSLAANKYLSLINPLQDSHVLDLGTGCGILLLMLARYFTQPSYTGIELLESLTKMAEQNFKKLTSVVGQRQYQFYTADYCDVEHLLGKNKYNLIISNPPHFQKNKGRINATWEKSVARHEIVGSLAGLMITIRNYLAPNGIAYVIYPEYRQNEIKTLCAQYQLDVDPLVIYQSSTLKTKIIYAINHKTQNSPC